MSTVLRRLHDARLPNTDIGAHDIVSDSGLASSYSSAATLIGGTPSFWIASLNIDTPPFLMSSSRASCWFARA